MATHVKVKFDAESEDAGWTETSQARLKLNQTWKNGCIIRLKMDHLRVSPRRWLVLPSGVERLDHSGYVEGVSGVEIYYFPI